MTVTYVDTPTKRITADNEIEYAYRDTGVGPVPLVLLQHFRGNLDNWDPALIDALAAGRRVVTFDNTGVGASSGTTPGTAGCRRHARLGAGRHRRRRPAATQPCRGAGRLLRQLGHQPPGRDRGSSSSTTSSSPRTSTPS